MSTSINQGWYDKNESRQFPLADDATAIDVNGNRLNDGLIADLVLTVPQDVLPEQVHLLNVSGFGTGLVVSIGINGVLAAAATIPSTHSEYDGYTIVGTGIGNGITGRVVIGQLSVFQDYVTQSLEFSLDAGKLASSVVRPRIGGVERIVLRDFQNQTYELNENVTLQGGNNVDITAAGSSLFQIHVSGGVVVDDGLSGNTDNAGNRPIRSINGVQPNANGELTLLGTNCLKLNPETNGIGLEDSCAQPCCGCDELEVVKTAANNIQASQDDLLLTIRDLRTEQNNLGANVARQRTK